MKGLKRSEGWGGLVLIAMLALSSTGCRFNFSSGSQGDPITLTKQEQAHALTAELHALGQLDAGECGTAWDEGAPVLKTMISRERFVAQAGPIRKIAPPGARRSLADGRFHSAPSNAPEGRYATFLNPIECVDATCTEEVVMMQVDGKWRLAGYRVKWLKLRKL